MPAIVQVDAATERLRNGALLALGFVYLLPAVYALPPNLNIVLTATLTVFTAGLRTVGKTHEAEMLSQKEAMRYPIIGSASLLGLFLAIRFLPKYIITYVITFYFCTLGVFAIGEMLYSTFGKYLPASMEQRKYGWKKVTIPLIMPEPEDIELTKGQALSSLVGLAFSAAYAAKRHYLLNNGLGLAYSIEGIAMIHLGSTTNGLILLWGLFLYDIFWVFFTPVMVAVATKLDGPIKLLFPSAAAAGKFNMLGLGDIVVPGLFVALMLHFDARNGSGKRYFHAAMVGYTAGLAVTIVVMNVFNAAQPALLYIVPCVCLAVFALAAARGEIRELLAFSEEEEEAGAAEGEEEETAEGEKVGAGEAGDAGQDDVPAELRTFDAGQTAPGFEVVGELKKAK